MVSKNITKLILSIIGIWLVIGMIGVFVNVHYLSHFDTYGGGIWTVLIMNLLMSFNNVIFVFLPLCVILATGAIIIHENEYDNFLSVSFIITIITLIFLTGIIYSPCDIEDISVCFDPYYQEDFIFINDEYLRGYADYVERRGYNPGTLDRNINLSYELGFMERPNYHKVESGYVGSFGCLMYGLSIISLIIFVICEYLFRGRKKDVNHENTQT